MIHYRDNAEGVTALQLQGFFVGWPDPPLPETHLDLLHRSQHVVVAIDQDSNHVVGFITALSDGLLSAYIPFLEVLPDYQGQGIGRKLVKRMLEQLNGLYMIDLSCDPELQSFYEQFGMRRSSGMMLRNYARQAGR